jgi:hypothetical protein
MVSKYIFDLLDGYEVASLDAFGLDNLAEGARSDIRE